MSSLRQWLYDMAYAEARLGKQSDYTRVRERVARELGLHEDEVDRKIHWLRNAWTNAVAEAKRRKAIIWRGDE
jgi:hypothetical protein